jgi:hypothetical protein
MIPRFTFTPLYVYDVTSTLCNLISDHFTCNKTKHDNTYEYIWNKWTRKHVRIMSLLDTDSWLTQWMSLVYSKLQTHTHPFVPPQSPEHQLTWREEGPICTAASEEARTQDRNGTKKDDVVHYATTYMHGAVRGG